MKKKLFLLFSIYFFVVQALIIGVLRWEQKFFRLAAINLIAIILISLVNTKIDTEKEETVHHEKKPESLHEPKVTFHDHLQAIVKERKKKSELALPFFLSIAAAIAFFLLSPYDNITLEALVLWASFLGFLIFVVLTLIAKHRFTKRFRSLIGTKLYLIFLLVSIALTAYDYYQIHQDYNASIQDYLAQNFLGEERIPTDGYVYTGEGTLLESGVWMMTWLQETSTDVFSGTVWTPAVQIATGTVIETSTNETTSAETLATTIGNQKLMDAVVYLIKKYNIPLITKKDMSFTYVSSSNEYYAQWRTAYASKLIGKSTNPSKYIICESYIVMKWLLEKWNVPYTASTVLSKFRAEATKRGALNGCEKGKIVTDSTL